MVTKEEKGHVDEVAQFLADYSASVASKLDDDVSKSVSQIVMDSLAVASGAMTHRASSAARRYAGNFVRDDGARIWGTSSRVDVETAALVNGVLLRCYDYNDFYMGTKNGGHPSDVVPGLIAVAEWQNLSGSELALGIAVSYEVIHTLMDTVSVSQNGWDYANLTAIGATCGVGRMLALNPKQLREALAIAVVAHNPTDEIESGDLNERGDLTMWKRFNGSHAARYAVYSCLLARAGAEGAIRPFTGRLGFFAQVAGQEPPIAELRESLDPDAPLARAKGAIFKRWPVGSRGQSAIRAALEARAQVSELGQIEQVRVLTDQAAYDHLVAIRDEPWNPVSRETADHSLPYIVAAAVVDGHMRTDSFDLDRVNDPDLRRFLQEKVTVSAVPEMTKGIAGGFPSTVELDLTDGSTVVGSGMPFPGHPKNPLSDADLEEKFHENGDNPLGRERVNEMVTAVWNLADLSSVRELAQLFVAPGLSDDLQS